MTNQDALVDCPLCSEKLACYSTKINETNSAYLCLGCGFAGNDLLTDSIKNKHSPLISAPTSPLKMFKL